MFSLVSYLNINATQHDKHDNTVIILKRLEPPKPKKGNNAPLTQSASSPQLIPQQICWCSWASLTLCLLHGFLLLKLTSGWPWHTDICHCPLHWYLEWRREMCMTDGIRLWALRRDRCFLFVLTLVWAELPNSSKLTLPNQWMGGFKKN